MKKGFTLVELLIAIAIIGVLSSLIVANLKNAKERAEQKKAMGFAHTVRVSLGSDLVGEWTFNDATNLGKDTSGYDNHGTNYGVSLISGIIRGASEFKSSEGDYLDCGGNTSLRPGSEITVEAWFKLSTISGTNTILSKDNPGPTNYWTDIRSNGTIIYVGGYTSAGGACYQGTSVSTISTDTWYHLAWTYNRKKIITYLNSDTISDVPKTCALNANDAPFRIGTRNGTGNMFNGAIDEVRIYNRALTTAEIQRHYTEGAAKHGIVLK
ncbi:prepilin-type N-terminal cleavage/methylation domain-containing protein [Candidatus Parcubacteria bacterium]|nr:prepilin-type N-terminal cleavage/methylation domain-containing protein [Candidatus Parcubacteria bacterium]